MKDPNGVKVRQSRHGVRETIDMLQEILKQRGVTIYARIDQQAELRTVGIELAPLEFILFGNPRSGGPLMEKSPLVTLDLPLKVIAFQDAESRVWVAYNEAAYIESRYSLEPDPLSPLLLDQLVDRVIH